VASDATKVDQTGQFSLPDDFLVGLYFPVHSSLTVDPSKFFLRSVAIFSTGYNVTIAYDDGTSSPPLVASANISKTAHVENTSYALAGSADFDDSVGKLVVGSTEGMDSAGAGQFIFDFDDGKLDPDVIRPMIRGVSSLTLVNGSNESDRLYGDIELVAGANIRLTPIVVSGQDPQIRIDAISGEGLIEECVCEGEDPGICIKRINGVSPTVAGDFTLVGDDCLELETIAHGIQLKDVCSDPCCGCEELEAITRDLERFGDAATTLRNFVNRLEAEVNQFSAVVLGSRLGDRGCLEC